jgi:ANTAR domain/GAF domain
MLRTGWLQQLLTAGATVGARIAQLCELCIEGLDVGGVSVQLVAAAPQRLTVHATDDVAGRLADLQLELGEGPAVDAAHTGGPAQESDLADCVRWPWFAPAAVGLGVGALFAFPVHVGATTIGVLELYRRCPAPLSHEERAEVVAVADAAAIVLLDNPMIGSDALVWLITDGTRFRAEVHQATGVLAVQLHLDVLDAFARLCAAAYTAGRPVAEVARDIVAGQLRLDDD